MEDITTTLIKLYGFITEGLFQKDIIDHCAQVGIVEYKRDQNINKYLVLHTDYYHVFQFEPHKRVFAIAKEALVSHGDIARKHSLSTITLEHDYIANTKKLFDTLKEIDFEKPITADYFEKLITERNKISFHASLPNYNKEINPPLRSNIEEWKFGSSLEYILMYREDAPVYANTFFSLENRIFAIAVFIQGKKISKFDEICEQLLTDFLLANNFKQDEIYTVIEQSHDNNLDINELIEFLKNAKTLLEFNGLNEKINNILLDAIKVKEKRDDKELQKKFNTLIEIQKKSFLSKKDIEKY
ncbi:MAG: hypothetical protein NTZ33_15545 [Bacteroidetes bacterium]|nr:hypothetical protein [Bacteroidota bacterium]